MGSEAKYRFWNPLESIASPRSQEGESGTWGRSHSKTWRNALANGLYRLLEGSRTEQIGPDLESLITLLACQ